MLSFIWYCHQLSRSQWLKPADMDRLQRKRLKALLKHAYENVPLYHEKFDSAGVKPDDINSMEDLSKLPFTTKSEINSGMPDKVIAKGYKVSELIKMPTSGTSGGPMPVYYDKRFWNYTSAAYYRLRRALGINPWDKCFQIHFWGPMPKSSDASKEGTGKKNKSRWQFSLGPLYSMFKRFQKTAFITYDADDIILDIINYQPKVLSGNPSYLRLIAETLTDKGIGKIRPKLLRCSGEVLDEPTRKFLEISFGCNVFDSYWSNERGLYLGSVK
jgi:phenylacetate-CoA ligase